MAKIDPAMIAALEAEAESDDEEAKSAADDKLGRIKAILDEEDEDMFAEAREMHLAGKIDLDALGDTLRARQAELYRQVEETGEVGPTDEADVDEIETV